MIPAVLVTQSKFNAFYMGSLSLANIQTAVYGCSLGCKISNLGKIVGKITNFNSLGVVGYG